VRAAVDGPIVCVGSPIVDLLDGEHAHLGGAATNVAVTAARLGAAAAICGAVGADPHGAWVLACLAAETVGTDWLLSRGTTEVVEVTFDGPEPAFASRNGQTSELLAALEAHLDAAVRATGMLYLTSNCLVEPGAARLVEAACATVRAAGRSVVLDVNLRRRRWGAGTDPHAGVARVLRHATIVKANLEEATWLTGRANPAEAVEALCAAGAELAIVSRGPNGVVARGSVALELPSPPAEVRSTLGAGDVLVGTLMGTLWQGDGSPATVEHAVRAAVDAAAHSTTRRGALT